MVLVRGNDALSGVQIAQQTSAWNTGATGSGAEAWYTVPLVSESLTVERDTLAVPKEMGQTGYREIFEYGRPTVKGSMTVIGRYDAPWFQIILAHAFWKETYVAQSWVDGTVLSAASGATVGNAGTGYTVGNTLTCVGGTFTTAMTLTVVTITGGGGTGPIGTLAIANAGAYSAFPTGMPIAVTGGSGSSATVYISNTASRKGNAHILEFGATLPKGLTIRVHKGGASQGYVDVFVGCMIGSFSLEQGDADVIKFTFNFSGYASPTNQTVTQASLGITSLPSIGGLLPIRLRDYNNYLSAQGDRGYIKVGATLTQLNLKSYRINVDRKLEFDSAFLNNLDDVQQPGVNDTREVTCEFVGSLEQGYNDNFTPHKEYMAKTASKADIVLTSALTNIAGYTGGEASNRPFAMRLEFPTIYWTAVTDSLQQGGANDATYKFTAVKGNFDVTNNLPGTTLGDYQGDFRAIASVSELTDANARFSSALSLPSA